MEAYVWYGMSKPGVNIRGPGSIRRRSEWLLILERTIFSAQDASFSSAYLAEYSPLVPCVWPESGVKPRGKADLRRSSVFSSSQGHDTRHVKEMWFMVIIPHNGNCCAELLCWIVLHMYMHLCIYAYMHMYARSNNIEWQGESMNK